MKRTTKILARSLVEGDYIVPGHLRKSIRVDEVDRTAHCVWVTMADGSPRRRYELTQMIVIEIPS